MILVCLNSEPLAYQFSSRFFSTHTHTGHDLKQYICQSLQACTIFFHYENMIYVYSIWKYRQHIIEFRSKSIISRLFPNIHNKEVAGWDVIGTQSVQGCPIVTKINLIKYEICKRSGKLGEKQHSLELRITKVYCLNI